MVHFLKTEILGLVFKIISLILACSGMLDILVGRVNGMDGMKDKITLELSRYINEF